MPSGRVIRSLDQIIVLRGKPNIIQANNGSEPVSGILMELSAKHHNHIVHIQPSKSKQNAYVESFNRKI